MLFRFPASNGGSAYGLAARAELTVKQRSRMLSKVLDMLEDPEPAEWAWSPVRDMSDAAFTLLYPASRAPAGRAERMTSRG